MIRLRTFGRAGAALLVIVFATMGAVSPAYAVTSILGGGSGFAALEVDQWRADTARSPFNLSVNYVAQGSSFGRAQFAQNTFDYGASDIQYVASAEQLPKKPFVYVPVSAGGMAFMYNLLDASGNRVSNLQLTRRTACKIFTGTITKWNDPEIVATNPQFASFNRSIRPVIRADGAGESYVFSEFCIAVAPDVWSAFVAQQRTSADSPNLSQEFLAGQPVSNWPAEAWGENPVPVPYADGTANYVADPGLGANSITYVAAGYAKVRQFPTASEQNAAGKFTQPDETNVTVALGYATPRGNGTFQLAFNGPDPRAYFPSTYSYILAPTAGSDPGKGATLAQFLCYAVSKGQVISPQLRYARLSSALVDIAIDAIVQIPGAPSKANCPVAGALPPPPPPVLLGGGSGPGSGSGPAGGPGAGPASGPSASVATAASARTVKAAAAAKAAAKIARQRAAQRLFALGIISTTTTSPDAALARAALAAQSKSSSDSPTIWILLAGVGAAWAVSAFVSLRQRVAS